jgi:hypothetical protein
VLFQVLKDLATFGSRYAINTVSSRRHNTKASKLAHQASMKALLSHDI